MQHHRTNGPALLDPHSIQHAIPTVPTTSKTIIVTTAPVGTGADQPTTLECPERRPSAPKSAHKGFRQLLNRRNMLSMQDQREESKNLSKWLSARNA